MCTCACARIHTCIYFETLCTCHKIHKMMQMTSYLLQAIQYLISKVAIQRSEYNYNITLLLYPLLLPFLPSLPLSVLDLESPLHFSFLLPWYLHISYPSHIPLFAFMNLCTDVCKHMYIRLNKKFLILEIHVIFTFPNWTHFT